MLALRNAIPVPADPIEELGIRQRNVLGQRPTRARIDACGLPVTADRGRGSVRTWRIASAPNTTGSDSARSRIASEFDNTSMVSRKRSSSPDGDVVPRVR